MIRKFAVVLGVVFLSTALDIVYLYYARTKGGLGFKLKILPDMGSE
jgi:hypothetical protein